MSNKTFGVLYLLMTAFWLCIVVFVLILALPTLDNIIIWILQPFTNIATKNASALQIVLNAHWLLVVYFIEALMMAIWSGYQALIKFR